MKTVTVLILAGLLAMVAHPAGAKELYVDGAAGSDSTSYAANSASNPWRTLGRAVWGSANRSSSNGAEAARAGDTVNVAAGIYTGEATDTRYTPAFNPVNSGTASSPLTIRAVGRVELRQTGGSGPVMGSHARNYVHWIGFVVNENFSPVHPDTGPIVIWDVTGVVIDGCEVQGIRQPYVDNHNGVRLEGARDSTVRNCRISGIDGPQPIHHNYAGIMLYSSRDIVLEHNEISDSGAGIFPKGADNYNITVRYNRLFRNLKGIRTTYSAPAIGNNRIYQNIIENSLSGGLGIQIAEYSYNWTVVNNTIVNAPDGIYLRGGAPIVNSQFANNVVVDADSGVNGGEWTLATFPSGGRNLYSDVRNWSVRGADYSSIGSWRTATPEEASSVLADPQFVSTSGGDYRLGANSPARTLGRDLLDLNRNGSVTDTVPAGAYVTGTEVIGRNMGPRPSSPSNLRVD